MAARRGHQRATRLYLEIFALVQLPHVVKVLASERRDVLEGLNIQPLLGFCIDCVCHSISVGSGVVARARAVHGFERMLLHEEYCSVEVCYVLLGIVVQRYYTT